ncbi:MAG: hypothetical protein LBK73_10805 [Treponema sp.]|nr:hypothetical protein [Treponema sp.]
MSNDITPYESASSLSKKGVAAIGCIAGGIGLLILGSLSPVAGMVAGAIAGVVGLCALTSKDPSDKTPGAIVVGAGALTIVSKLPFVGFLAKPFLGLGVIILLGVGIWNGFKFLKGLKARH